MANERLRQEFRTGLISSPPISFNNAVQTSSDSIKSEFSSISSAKYTEIVQNLRVISQYHDLQEVLDALRQDFGLQ